MVETVFILTFSIGAVIAGFMHLMYKWDVPDEWQEITSYNFCEFCVCFWLSVALLIPYCLIYEFHWVYLFIPFGSSALALKIWY